MMLGHVIAEKAQPVIGGDDLQSRFVIIGERQIRAVDVIEDAEFHDHRRALWAAVAASEAAPASRRFSTCLTATLA